MPGIAACKFCGRDIIWLVTYAGKNIPVEPESFDDEKALALPASFRFVYDAKRGHKNHFENCKDFLAQAKQNRADRRAGRSSSDIAKTRRAIRKAENAASVPVASVPVKKKVLEERRLRLCDD